MNNDEDDNGLPPPFPAGRPRHPRSIASLGKRSRGYSYSNSSDAPYFSSDDLADAGLDDYTTPRRKKQSRRTWWEAPGDSTPSQRDYVSRVATQPKDSGVFMSSDSSSNDDGFSVGQLSAQNLKRHGKKFAAEVVSPRAFAVEKPVFDPEAVPRRIVQACLENDQEEVDLSGCNITILSNATLRPLRNLIRRPRFHQDHRVDEAFRSFTPELKLFFSSNLLRRVPGEILNLEHLTVLSLRNNRLTELPHSIGRLENLQELNIAGNRLTWLPGELLNLCGSAGKLRNLNLAPNPFFTPLPASPSFSIMGSFGSPENHQGLLSSIEILKNKMGALETSPHNEILKEKMSWALHLQETHLDRLQSGGPLEFCKKAPVYLGSTPVTFFDFDGMPSRSAHAAPSQMPRSVHVLAMKPSFDPITPRPLQSRGSADFHGPSLFELALRSCADNLLFADIDKALPETTPEAVVRMLEAARNSQEDGGTRCCNCRARYIVPRAEWIEYWHCWPDRGQVSVDELFFPFLRRTCSWGCADVSSMSRISK